MSKKVALMCGHGTSTTGAWDAGCCYSSYTEAGLMLPITKAAVKYLRNCGVTVISDADTNNNKNMIADVEWANSWGADVYVSVHCDYSGAPAGVCPLYVSSGGKTLATKLNDTIKAEMGMKSRGIAKRTDLWELNGTDAVACILETGAIKADLSILKNKSDAYGKAIAKGICKYLGVTFKETASTSTTSTATTTAATSALTKTIKNMQKWLGVSQTGQIAGQNKELKEYYTSLANACKFDGGSGKSDTVKKLQKVLGVTADGVLGPNTIKKFQTYLNSNQTTVKLTVDGYFGANSLKALNAFLAKNPPLAKDYVAPKTTTTTVAKPTTTIKKVTTSSTKNTSTYNKFINALNSYGAVIEKTFKYSNSNSKTTWSAAKKNKISNCARYVSWCLQAAGILSSGKVIYYTNAWKGNGVSQLKKSSKVKVSYPKKKPSKCGLQVGDICCFKNHTMVYAGKNSKGKMLWWSGGSSDMKKKNVTKVGKSSYNSKPIYVLIRIKK